MVILLYNQEVAYLLVGAAGNNNPIQSLLRLITLVTPFVIAKPFAVQFTPNTTR